MGRKTLKPKVGDIVMITFLDHAMTSGDDDGHLEFEVFGRLVHISDTHYVVGHWLYTDRISDDNCEFHHIVKTACTSVKALR